MAHCCDLLQFRARLAATSPEGLHPARCLVRLDDPDATALRQLTAAGETATVRTERRGSAQVVYVQADCEAVTGWVQRPEPVCRAVGHALSNALTRRRGLTARGRTVPFGTRPAVMGIVNCTPDSFSDGGLYLEADRAVEHALSMVAAGVDVLDIGGMSSRPGSEPVPVDEEIRRTEPVVRRLADRVDVPISIDTCRPAVARCALEAGAHIVNDITALGNPEMASLVKRYKAAVVLMHMRGTPQTMQKAPRYRDVVSEVYGFLAERIRRATDAGIPAGRIVVDPGIGFGKTASHNLQLMKHLAEFRSLGCPVLLGMSRKRFIGKVTGRDVDNRLGGSLAGAAAAFRAGIEMVRVHDAVETVDLLTMLSAMDH